MLIFNAVRVIEDLEHVVHQAPRDHSSSKNSI